MKAIAVFVLGLLAMGAVIGFDNDGSYRVKEFGSTETTFTPLAHLQGISWIWRSAPEEKKPEV